MDILGLIHVIQELIERIESIIRTRQMKITIQHESEIRKLEDKWSVIYIYRVVQEMFTNSIKYEKVRKYLY